MHHMETGIDPKANESEGYELECPQDPQHHGRISGNNTCLTHVVGMGAMSG